MTANTSVCGDSKKSSGLSKGPRIVKKHAGAKILAAGYTKGTEC